MTKRANEVPRYAAETTISVAQTKAEIETLCRRYGANSFASGHNDRQAALTFVIQGRMVRFILPSPTEAEVEEAKGRFRSLGRRKELAEKWRQQEERRRWRCLLLSIKSRFEVMASGIETFEEAFLPHVVTTENITVYQQLQRERSGVKMLNALPDMAGA